MPNSKDGFFSQVFQVVRLIPNGRVTSYGAIAKYLGSPRSSRVVGYAMNDSHSQREFVPAHRVVNSQGLLTGKHHFADPTEMERLLKKEGAKIKGDKILNFKEIYWDPVIELTL